MRFVGGASREELGTNELLLSGILYKLTVIGEAAARLSPGVHASIPEIPWRSVVGFRNMIVHEYFGLDLDIVWTTASAQVPLIAEAIERFRRRSG